VLPHVDPAPRFGKNKPLVNFLRSSSGWSVDISLPEPAIQFGYRIGEDGEFVDAGTIYVTWRDKRGEESGVFPLKFDPDDELRASVWWAPAQVQACIGIHQS
jgi:hypothetical protein